MVKTNKPDNTSAIRNEGGFLLIELLLAAAVLALVGAVVLGSFATSFRAMRTSDNMTRATMLLQEKLVEIEQQGIDAPAEGGFGENEPGFLWRAVPSGAACESRLCPVTVFVQWDERGKKRQVQATSFSPQKLVAR